MHNLIHANNPNMYIYAYECFAFLNLNSSLNNNVFIWVYCRPYPFNFKFLGIFKKTQLENSKIFTKYSKFSALHNFVLNHP